MLKPLAIAVVAMTSLLSVAGCGAGASKSTAQSPQDTVAPPPAQPQASGADAGAASLSNALAAVRDQGFASNGSTYHPDRQLRVITALRDDSVSGTAQQAFFFVGDRFIGTDTNDTSAGITLLGQDDTTVTLNYLRYASHDPMCCASESFTTVRYHWDGANLQPLDPIPPSDPAADGSRR